MAGGVTITAELIEASRSPAGGWTRETLVLLGEGWPPRKGWRQHLLGKRIPREAADRLRGKTSPPAPTLPDSVIPRQEPPSSLERLYRENEAMANDDWWRGA